MNNFFELINQVTGNFWWLNIVLALFVIFFGRKKPQSTVIWVMLLTFLPVVGFLLYLFLDKDYNKMKKFEVKKNQDKIIKQYVDHQEENIETGKFFEKNPRLKQFNQLLSMNLKSDEAFVTTANEVEIFYSGDEKFNALFEDIKNAKKSIDVEYYIFKHDMLGKKLLNLLEDKLRENVHVRLLVDGYGGGKILRRKDVKRFKELGGQFAVFFPAFLGIQLLNFRLNYRNHRKIVIIDDEVGYIGGFNVGDEYLGLDEKMGYWRDTHIRVKGEAVHSLKIRFLKDWYYASKEDLNSKDKKDNSHFSLNDRHKNYLPMQIVTSGPDTDNNSIKHSILKMIASAKEEIIIQTPYFIIDDAVMDALKIALLSGVSVKIMIPSKPDHPFIYWATTSWTGELLEAGAEVYIYQKGFLHAKVILVDGIISSIGSANMDIRSFTLNFEANALLYDTKINQNLRKQFEKDLSVSKLITFEMYKKRPVTVKIKEAFSRLLSPLL